MPVSINSNQNGGYEIIARIEREMTLDRDGSAVREAIKEMVQSLAEEWVIEHLNDVYVHINAEAVANAVLMEASTQIASRLTQSGDKSE